MNVQWLLLVAVAALSAGCSSMDADQEVRRHPGNPVNCPGNGPANACVIPIAITDSSCDADKIVLEDFVDLGDFRHKKRVFWTLPAGYEFCPRTGDGVFLKDPTVPADVYEPLPGSTCSDTFVWRRKKADRNHNDYEYLVRFQSTAKRSCVKDPWMRN